MNINFSVAQNIKNIREKKKLTLDEATKLTGVSRSMLAQIERGDANPTVSVLWKIANGYKVSFTSLVEQSDGGETETVILAQNVVPVLESDGNYINYPVFGFDEKKGFETYRIVIEGGGKLVSEPHLVGTEEYITVFSGSVNVELCDKSFLLKKGDALRFCADVQHTYTNPSDDRCELSMLIYYGEG